MHRLNKFLDIHRGETCVIVGNGPSLNAVPLRFLYKYDTFGTNLIYLHDCFQPTYYVAIDPTVNRGDFAEQVNSLNSVKFLSKSLAHLVGGCVEIKTCTDKEFLYGETSFCEGWSVTYVALQLAYFMGFETVLLVGVDHRYNHGQSSHFHPDYEAGYEWVEHDMTKAIPFYQLARDRYKADGRKVLNLTPKSDLKVFPYQKIQDWM